jgi:hypothetical protein
MENGEWRMENYLVGEKSSPSFQTAACRGDSENYFCGTAFSGLSGDAYQIDDRFLVNAGNEMY